MFTNLNSVTDPWEKTVLLLMNAGVYDGTILRDPRIKNKVVMDLELLCSPGSSLAKILLFIPNKNGNFKTTSVVITNTGSVYLTVGDIEKKRYSFGVLHFLAIVEKVVKNLLLIEQGLSSNFPYQEDKIDINKIFDYVPFNNDYVSHKFTNMYNVQRLDFNDLMEATSNYSHEANEKIDAIDCFNLAIIAVKESNIVEAKELYLKAIEGGVKEAFLNLGIIEKEAGNLDLARKLFFDAIKAGDYGGYNGLGVIEFEEKNYDLAREYYSEGFSFGIVSCAFNLGELEEENGFYGVALDWYSMAAEKGLSEAFDKQKQMEILLQSKVSSFNQNQTYSADSLTNLKKNKSYESTPKTLITFVMGLQTVLNQLVEQFSLNGFEVKQGRLDQIYNHGLNSSFYFVTSFKNMMTAYEVEFLKEHPFIKNIICVDPDFDEYEDVVIDFKRRFPDKVFHVYDERAFSNTAASVYSREQIDFIHSNSREILCLELLRKNKFEFEWTLNSFAEFSVQDSETVMEEMNNKVLRPSFEIFRKELQKSNATETKLNLKTMKENIFFENDAFDGAVFNKLSKIKLWSIFAFIVAISIDYLLYNNFTASLKDWNEILSYVQSRTWPITVYTSIFMVMHFAIIIFEFKWVEFRKFLSGRDKNFVDCVTTAIAENKTAIDTAEIFSKKLDEEFVRSEQNIFFFLKNNLFRQYTKERLQGVQQSISKKAA